MSFKRVSVIGLGGCGCNSVKYLVKNIESEDLLLYCCTTELVSKGLPESIHYIQLGEQVTHGISTGGNVDKGSQATEATLQRLAETFTGSDFAIVCAGLGGGTGTGALPVVLRLLRELNVLPFVVVTLPFPFEGKKKANIASQKIQQLIDDRHNLVVIDNAALSRVLDKKTSLQATFDYANKALHSTLSGVLNLILKSGYINIDLADLGTVLGTSGICSVGEFVVPATDADELSASLFINPLSPPVDLSTGKAAILHIQAPQNINLATLDIIGTTLQRTINSSALIVTGVSMNEHLENEVKVFYIISGLS